MKPLRTAVIGVGYLGRFHAQKYKALPQSQLVAVMDANPERAQAVADELGVEAVTSLEAILGRVDAVSVAAPTTLHHAIGKACLEAGVHVLMEKPVAANSAQALELADLADEKGLILQVGFLERYNPAFTAIAPWLQNPQFIESIRISPFKERGHDVDVVLDLMIHDLDLVFSLIKSPLAHLHAVGISLMTDQTDLANVRLVFENGAVADLTASRISAKAERKFRVFQKDRYMSLDMGGPSAKVYSANRQAAPKGPPPVEEKDLGVEKGDALLEEVKAFLGCVAQKGQPAADGRQSVTTMRVAERIIEDIAKNRLPS